MLSYKVILIIIIVVIIIATGALLINKFLSSNSSNQNICNFPDCVNKSTDCNIMDPSKLTKCNPQDPDNDFCYNCYGNMTCQTIKDKSYIIYALNESDCPSPYTWDYDPNDKFDVKIKKCMLPGGNFCLPFEIPDISCNQFTGSKVLAKVSEHAPYQYLCLCKDDIKFTNQSGIGDCDLIRLCGINSEPNSTGAQRQLVRKPDSSELDFNCTYCDEHYTSSGELWTKDSCWDPVLCGTCKCGNQEFSTQFLTCVGNSCYPGSQGTDPSNCICPQNSISCDFTSGQFIGSCKIPSCIPDPCYPGGVFDKSANNGLGGCKCNADNGYVTVPSLYSSVGEICVNWCNTSQNPCGDRGKCVMNTDQKTENDFLFVFESTNDPSGALAIATFSSFQNDPNNAIYIYYDPVNKNLSLKNILSKFQILMCMDSTCSQLKIVTEPQNTEKYYLSPDYGKTFVYLDTDGTFKTNDFTGAKITGLWQIVLNPDEKEIVTGKIFMNSYYMKNNNGNLGIGIDNLNQAECINCAVPYRQDSTNICAQVCLPNPTQIYNGQENECCSCTSCYDSRYGIRTCCGDGGSSGQITKNC